MLLQLGSSATFYTQEADNRLRFDSGSVTTTHQTVLFSCESGNNGLWKTGIRSINGNVFAERNIAASIVGDINDAVVAGSTQSVVYITSATPQVIPDNAYDVVVPSNALYITVVSPISKVHQRRWKNRLL